MAFRNEPDYLDVPYYNYMGGPDKFYECLPELEADVVHKLNAFDMPLFHYWPVAQRTTEWYWLTGKPTDQGKNFFDPMNAEPIIQITASNAPAILGVDPNCSRGKLHKTKRNPNDCPQHSDYTQSILNWGIDHEPVARDTVVRAMRDNWQDEKLRYLYECGTFQHPRKSYLGATPDGFFTSLPYVDDFDAVRNMTCALEIKCPWKLTLPRCVPVHHMVQMQVQMECMDLEDCIYFVWTPQESRSYPVKRSRDFWNKVLAPEIDTFVDRILTSAKCPNLMEGHKERMTGLVHNYCPETKFDPRIGVIDLPEAFKINSLALNELN